MRHLVAAVALLALPLSALAGFHESLSCMECHVRTPAAGEISTLRGTDETALCLRCHEGGRDSAPDVMHDGLRGRRLGGIDAGRPAGGLSRVGDASGLRGAHGELTGHTLGSTSPPPGFTGTWVGGPLSCKSCHAVHPNGNFRNLGADPFITDPAYRAFARSTLEGAVIPRAAAGQGAIHRAGASGSADPANDPALAAPGGASALDGFCASCHPAFHGEANTTRMRLGTRRYVRHPTGRIAIGTSVQAALAGVVQPMRVTERDRSTVELGCVTCHRAHGSTRPFGLVWWDRDSLLNGEDGAGVALESLCVSCHRLDDDGGFAVARTGR